MNTRLTEGRIVFLMATALSAAAIFSLIKWNQVFSMALITAFILLAQETVTGYFESPNDDTIQIKIVLLLTGAYCVLFGVCVATWNEMAGGEVIGGFVLFVRKMMREYFKPGNTNDADAKPKPTLTLKGLPFGSEPTTKEDA